MSTYFNLKYEFDRVQVHASIATSLKHDGANYICVADGVILDNTNRNPEYLKVVNDSLFSVCDSSFVPVYIRLIYGVKYEQYCGSQFFMDIVKSCKYRMFFMGTSHNTLNGLKSNLTNINPDVESMTFYELPFKSVDEFDYPAIAKKIEQDGADIIWIALGAPKQEYFMSKLKPYLSRGVMIAVGAAFKFYSGTDVRRAPQWMIKLHMEFIHRIFKEPKKQIRRCWGIVTSLPILLWQEWRRSKNYKII